MIKYQPIKYDLMGQRDDLHTANNLLLGRARVAEAEVKSLHVGLKLACLRSSLTVD